MGTRISEHFTLEEFVTSQTAARQGIDNTPDAASRRNLRRLAGQLELVRGALGGKPVLISSGYRCKALNDAIGGSSSSAHMAGLAADFSVPDFGSVLQTARAVAECGVDFDQLIVEYGRWLHLGLCSSGSKPRRELLSIGSQGRYVSGLTLNC